MNIVSVEKVSKSYTDKPLLTEVTLGVGEADKIGVIGINGTGKSTLLKIIAGLETADSGGVVKSNGVRIGYLPQNPEFDEEHTVLEQALAGVSPAQRESMEYECKTILNRLGITNFDQKIGQLSGGQKKRVAMACALATPVELLILDEPTNHVDNDTVSWLESFLKRYRGALLMVTHDRYFLERVTNRIVEVQDGKLYDYPGNYEAFLALKAEREEMQAASQRKLQSLLRKEAEWIHRGARARSTKARFRVERFETLSEQAGPAEQERLELGSASSRLGKKIVEIDSLEKSFGERTLIRDFTYYLLRDDRLGIVGPNGCGKSTLLKLILGQLEPDKGSIAVGDTVRFGYFSQECGELDPNQRVIDAIRDISNAIETSDGTLTAALMLERFLFSSDLQYSPVGKLSGGERRRLHLLRVLMDAPNVLLMDEPTNDLDIQTLTILEDYLDSFAGAVVIISHDRYFLDKTVDHIFAFEEDGIRPYLGGGSDYLERRSDSPKPAEKSVDDRAKTPRSKSEKLKFTFNEQREFDTIDNEIASLETRIEETALEITSQSSDYTRLQELIAEKEALEQALAQKMERWVYLNDLADQIAAQ